MVDTLVVTYEIQFFKLNIRREHTDEMPPRAVCEKNNFTKPPISNSQPTSVTIKTDTWVFVSPHMSNLILCSVKGFPLYPIKAIENRYSFRSVTNRINRTFITTKLPLPVFANPLSYILRGELWYIWMEFVRKPSKCTRVRPVEFFVACPYNKNQTALL